MSSRNLARVSNLWPVRTLLLPLSRDAKGYRSMYAYGNHIIVCGAVADLSTCDSGVAATFLQSCRSSSSDKNMRTVNLEYVGWMEEIISVDYGKFEVVVLYCTGHEQIGVVPVPQ